MKSTTQLILPTLALSALAFILILSTGSVFAQEVLPFPEPPMGGEVGPTMQESVHKWRQQPRHLPEDAPNILIIMLDDAGFGHPSTFGGEIKHRLFRGWLKKESLSTAFTQPPCARPPVRH